MGSLSIFAVYIAGVMTSFTPCVYPLIPIVVSFIGAQAELSLSKRVLLTLVYILGTSLVYSILGAVAALSGSIFGLTQNSFLANLIVGVICLIFSLSLFGLFSINIQLTRFVPTTLFKGYVGGFILGATSGLVFSPCTTPVLGSILTLVATKQSVIYGITLLFIFALGLSTTIFLAGIFSGILTKLPKSGKWNLIVEKIFATILLIISIYYFLKAFQFPMRVW